MNFLSISSLSLKVRRCSRAARLLPLCATIYSVASLAPATSAAPKAAAKPAAKSPANVASDYRLSVGDSLGVTVSNHPDINSEATVRPDGKITLPRAGDVVAAGKTAPQLAREIEKILARTLNNARVQVIVKTTATRQAVVSGAVKSPGPYPIRNGLRAIDLISLAGGLSTKPTRIKGRIIRQGRDIPFDVAGATSNPTSAANLLLRADDLIILDAQDFAKQLTVTGNVNVPGNYDLNENLTVASLLAQAGGLKTGASARNAYVLRAGQNIPLDLSAVQSGFVPAGSPLNNFKFELGDVLTVPANLDRIGVSGEVKQPNYYPLPEDKADATLLRVLALAGGPQENADLSKATVTRVVNGEQRIIPVDIAAIQNGQAPDNIVLRPDDALFVPKRDSNVIVSGAVGTPGSYPITDSDTLLSVLAKAGDPSKNASLRNVSVLRDGKQIQLDLRPVLVENALDPQISGFRLQRGDVIRVPDISDQVTVSGAIARPGVYNLTDDLSVVSLLAQAGNGTDKAALSKAYVLRQGVPIPLDLNVFLSGAKDQPSLTGFRLKANDTLVIPVVDVFYAVVGQVGTPGKFAYPDNPNDATVLNALINAGGPLSGRGEGNADLKNAGIVRQINGSNTMIPVNLNSLFNKKNEDNKQSIVLQPNDVLYVPAKGRGFEIGTALSLAFAARTLTGF